MTRMRRIVYGLLVSICAVFLAAPSGVSASELLLLTEENPPISFDTNGICSGLACELVEAIESRVGEQAPIRVMPWARAYKLALEQPEVALFVTVRTPEREKLFKWMGPLMTGVSGFYAKKSSSLRITSLDEARKVHQIIVPREYYSQQFLLDRGFANLDVVNTPEMMLRMLLAGHGDLMVGNSTIVPTLLKRVGANASDINLVYSFMQTDYYVSFSLGTPDPVVQAWQRAFDGMKADGSYQKIYARWQSPETPIPDSGMTGPMHID